MKLEDFKKFVREDKTIDMAKLMQSFSKENFDAVTGLFTMTGDKDILIEICKTYAITFALLEDALHFNFISCVTESYMKIQCPEILQQVDDMFKEERDLDDERSWGPQDTEDDDDIVQ